MNKLGIICCICSMITVFGCATVKEPDNALPASDVYSDTQTGEILPTGKDQFKDTIATIDPYEIGVISLSTTNSLGFGFNQTTMKVLFAPRENAVLVKFIHAGAKYTLSIDPRDRVLVISSIRSYLEDFAERRLEKDRDTVGSYGTVKLMMDWGLLTVNAVAEPKVKLGYTFEKNAPYYCLTFPETANLIYQKDLGSRVKNSGYMRWYMTRSQAEAFGNMLDQAFLESTLSTQTLPGGSAEPDAY